MREKEAEALGEEVKKQMPEILDNTRELGLAMVLEQYPEVAADETGNEFAPYFGSEKHKVLITTRPRPSQNLFHFIANLQKLSPALHFFGGKASMRPALLLTMSSPNMKSS